jgi:hypothetical protein
MRDDKPVKVITGYEVTLIMGPRKVLRRRLLPPLPPDSPLTVELGQDPSALVVAFTGFTGQMSLPTFDFLGTAELLKYSRILLCDKSRTCYLNGLSAIAEDVATLTALLREHIERMGPKHTIFIGSSGGSHAAILFGHLLRADFVHAFSAYTNLDPAYWRSPEMKKHIGTFGDALERLDRVPAAARAYFDLREVLREYNGKTAYNLHVCAQSESDMARTLLLDGLPGVTIHEHGCNHHAVVVWLARLRRLTPLLKVENQRGPATEVEGEPTPR